MDGNVIGINARAITFGENLGFAIPINTAKLVIDRILKDKEVKRSYIGIEWQEIKDLKYYKNEPTLSGVLVAHIDKNSPAEKAGIQPGDIIYAMNDDEISAVFREELPFIRKRISEIPVGDQIVFQIKRGDKNLEIDLNTDLRGKFEGNEFECEEWGISVKEITPRIVKNFKLENSDGVLVSGIRRGSLADDAEIFRGDIITQIDDKQIIDLDQFKEIYESLATLPEKGRMLQLTYRNSVKFALLKEK